MEGDVIDTELVLDAIQFPSDRYEDLAGLAFRFPVNPVDGYIDGSIYVRGRHHLVDVNLIEFGPLQGEAMSLGLRGEVDYQCFHVNQCITLPLGFTTMLRTPASPAAIALMVEEAVTMCGATSPKHLGLVMRALKPRVFYEAQMGDFADAAKLRLAAIT